jgi:hypothetical protein
MMQVQLAEVSELESQHVALAQRITALVDAEGNANEVARLVREKAALSARIAEAKTERDRAEREQAANLQAQAREDFPLALAECEEQRTAFLEHRRAACIALGRYFPALNRAFGLCNKLAHPDVGPFPADLNACRALELGDDPERSLSDLEPDMGANWKTSFPVTPRYETHNSRR